MTMNTDMSRQSGEIGWVGHLRRFAHRPPREKRQIFRWRIKRAWNRLFPRVPLPVPLPFGGWWLARNDGMGDMVFGGGYEEAERRFVESWLRPGMVVLDLGAHNGFYTLLASRRVGSTGLVVAFEPSPRERNRLLTHLQLNRCKNVHVESLAVGDARAKADFFVVDGAGTGLNSLRCPSSNEPVQKVTVSVTTLDDYLLRTQLSKVDFVKMDVEGAELSVLKGGGTLLRRRPRPIILCEVEDARTKPWGYEAQEIIQFLLRLDYGWFLPLQDGHLVPLPSGKVNSERDLVAIPSELHNEVKKAGLIELR
jgi:FkbM family methyltransferase